ncbi:ankyrin repeat-containing domain protein [Cercophora newfieldiana]|uniref:Ankyrin repeat-containing domain protein n=1 Tax=Cercophora newfieldiana TaxID=92897 RepID=A0AA39Y1A0_9PEZI|nr:ankyrin repeat-containing domain protein [Cercophora newfieldiana]
MAPVQHESLYKVALRKFKKAAEERYRDDKDREILHDFLRQNASPEDAKQAAESLAVDSKKKYSSKNLKVGDVEIPQTWIDNILGNINNFVAAGDKLAEGAPESVALAWWAISKSLGAIQANYELYSLFGTGLSDISEIMVLIRHYDRLYDEQSKPGWKPSPLVEKLFQDIVAAYTGVLEFSLAIRRHLSAGTLARIRHGIKDFYGGNKGKFEGKLAVVAELKGKILEESQAAFQDRTLTQLEGVSGVLSDIASTVNSIKDLRKEQEEWHNQSMAMQTALLKSFEEIKTITKPRTRWDYALQQYQKIQGILNPIGSSDAALSHAIDARHPGTCEWVFEAEEYVSWDTANENALLSITGQEGTGKSIMVATIVERLGRNETADNTLLYLSCGTSANAAESVKIAYTADTICNTFLSNLFSFAAEDANKPELLESCNEAFANPKARKGARATGSLRTSKAEEELPDFADAFARVAANLKKDVVLVLDGVDKASVNEADQIDLFQRLSDLVGAKNVTTDAGIRIQILVGCGSSTRFFSALPPQSYIDLSTRNGGDIELALTAALAEIAGLSAAEQEEAKTAVLKKTGFRFDYLTTSAIPFLREPFQRPLSRRLLGLPEGISDTYARELRRMKPNYVELLRTTLTWSLLATQGRLMHVGEIMDIFHGIYDTPPEDDDAEADVEPGFPPLARLEVEQLRATGGPFFDVYDDGEYALIELPDRLRVSEFCLDKAPEPHEEAHDEELCVRCKGLRSGSDTISISSKEGHLQLALTCLRHLNHPLFQKRANLLEERPATEADDASEPSVVAAADGGNGGEGPDADAKGYESDASRDDEDEGAGWDRHDEDDDGDEDGEEYDEGLLQWSRYEMQFWPAHLREAEARWPEEEREGNETWAAVMAELDKFASAKPLVFENWQRNFHEKPNSQFFSLASGCFGPLHVAASLGLSSWTKELLSRGADPNTRAGGFTALQAAAAERRSHRVIELLVAAGGDLNTHTDEWEMSAQHAWYSDGIDLKTAQLFLSLGADPTLKSHVGGWTALHYLAHNGDGDEGPKILDLFLAKGADVNARSEYQHTPLHALLWRSHAPLALVEAFVKAGSDVNAEDVGSQRPLQSASMYGELGILKIIVEADVSEIDDPDQNGATALYVAAQNGHTDCVRFLLQSGASASLAENHGTTPLHFAAIGGHLETVKLLLEHAKEPDSKVDVNAVDRLNRTPFFYSCLSKSQATALLLLDTLVERSLPLSEINKKSRGGRTPLRQAASHGFDIVVMRLAEMASEQNDAVSLDINAQDANGKGHTALHRAALGGYGFCVQRLLHSGADLTLRDTKGRTPLVIAYEQWAIASTHTAYENIVSILITRDPDAARDDAELVAVSAAKGSVEILRQLFNLNANLSRPDHFGWTPLQLARNTGPSAAAAADFLKRQSAWAGLLPSRWATEYPCATIGPAAGKSVAEDGTTITYLSNGENLSLSTNRPLPPGLEQYYFEVTLENIGGGYPQVANPEVAIGFCTIGAGVVDFPGWLPKVTALEAKSWAYHGDDGGVYRSTGTIYADEYLKPFGPGDTIGCAVDLAKHEISWTRNGVKLDATVKDVEGRLFPIIGMSTNVKVETNFGTGPFKWKGPEETGDAAGRVKEVVEVGVGVIIDGVQALSV